MHAREVTAPNDGQVSGPSPKHHSVTRLEPGPEEALRDPEQNRLEARPK